MPKTTTTATAAATTTTTTTTILLISYLLTGAFHNFILHTCIELLYCFGQFNSYRSQ